MEPLTDVREISRIAYGFIASKALFAALDLDVFGVLSGDGKTCADTASAAGIAESRMATLLAALINAGLVQQDGETFKNASAPERYLARGARAYFGDYYRFQIDRKMYTALIHFEPVLRGDAGEGLDFQAKSDSMSDPAEAEARSRSLCAGATPNYTPPFSTFPMSSKWQTVLSPRPSSRTGSRRWAATPSNPNGPPPRM